MTMPGWLKNILIFPFVLLIKFYQVCVSPFTPPACRFTPTCSQYALEAFRKHGPFKGLYLSVRRILRSCGDRMPSIFSFASATPVTSSFFRISCRFPRSVAVARFMLVALLNGCSPPIAIASAFSSGFVIW